MTLRDWAYIADLSKRHGGTNWGRYEAEARAIEPRARLRELGMLYQDMLYGLARVIDATLIVETGVRTGVSTRFLLEAVAASKRQHFTRVYSCDPLYKNAREAGARLKETSFSGDRLFPLWTFYPGKSTDALPKIAEATTGLGGWHLFLHDSDHGPECQTFELDFAWPLIAPGGLLVCDDWDWACDASGARGGKPHGAFQKFLDRRGLRVSGYIGTAAVVEKSEDS